MNPLLAYRWNDLPRLTGIVLIYVLLARISLDFTTILDTITILWVPGGFALAALLIYGKKFWPAIVVGEYASNLLAGQTLITSGFITIGASLEPLLGAWLLTRNHRFDISMQRLEDFFRLFLLAGCVSPGVSAVNGVLTLLAAGILTTEMIPTSLLNWWLGNMFSIIIITPCILIWRQPLRFKLTTRDQVEYATLFTLVVLTGFILFLGWLHDSIGQYVPGFLLFIFMVWAALRFGRHGVMLILCPTLILGLWGLTHGIGFFHQTKIDIGLVNFWIYFSALAAVGMILASSNYERKKKEAALLASELRFTSFMENLPGLAHIKDTKRRFIYLNKEYGKILGDIPASFLYKTIDEINPGNFPPETLKIASIDDESVLYEHRQIQSEFDIGEGHGKRTMLSIKFPVADGNDDLMIGSIALDITSRKRAEARVDRLTRLYRALNQINQGIMRLSDESELFPLVSKAVVDFGSVKMVWIGRFDADTERILPVTCHGADSNHLDGLVISASASVPEGRGPTGTAFREGRSVLINDPQTNDMTRPWHALTRFHNLHSIGAFPIQRANKPYAVLTAYSEQSGIFDAETIALLEKMSRDVSFALDNFDREQQRRSAQDAWRSSEDHFRAFFERSMVGMATSSPEKGWIEVNDALCLMLGYTREELLRTTWAEITHPEDLHADIALFDRVMNGEIDDYTLDKRYLRKEGGIVHTHIAARCLRKKDGSVDYFVVLVQDTTEQKLSDELIWKQANFDPLTGLLNRRMFRDRLKQEIVKSNRTKLPLAMLFIDLDRFKEVNDTLGHAKGDMLLVEAAHRISDSVRETDTVARLGGDEFMIILAQLPDTGQVELITRHLLTRLAEAFDLGSESVFLSASIGITFYPADATDAEQLVRNADQAMYVAKNQGRNGFSYFTYALQEAAQSRLKLINDMRSALTAGDQFMVYFQPIVDMSSQQIYKAETLIRWQHPVMGMISPAEFIPLAEETGLIIEIGDWVFRQAAQWARRWEELTPTGLRISVNMSPLQFRADNNSTDMMIDYMHTLGLTGQSIIIEITEGLLLNAESNITDKLLKFRDAGMQVAIDDFGTGYSSLSYLKKFDIDYLKIDQSFVRNIATDPDDMALSEAIIVMAHKLGLKVIAEGVETEQQRALLAAAGCDYAQGYLFSRPVPPQEFAALLRQSAITSDCLK